MDLTAEFYLDTVEVVFQKHLIPTGQYRHRGDLIRPQAIRDIGLMTIEGEKDDITGRGQTRAAQDLCTGLPDQRKLHYVQPRVGHYGVFNGTRFRNHIQPKMRNFIRAERSMVQG
jgi:poly(3-hydroxybutyrate) depolymerase